MKPQKQGGKIYTYIHIINIYTYIIYIYYIHTHTYIIYRERDGKTERDKRQKQSQKWKDKERNWKMISEFISVHTLNHWKVWYNYLHKRNNDWQGEDTEAMKGFFILTVVKWVFAYVKFTKAYVYASLHTFLHLCHTSV